MSEKMSRKCAGGCFVACHCCLYVFSATCPKKDKGIGIDDHCKDFTCIDCGHSLVKIT